MPIATALARVPRSLNCARLERAVKSVMRRYFFLYLEKLDQHHQRYECHIDLAQQLSLIIQCCHNELIRGISERRRRKGEIDPSWDEEAFEIKGIPYYKFGCRCIMHAPRACFLPLSRRPIVIQVVVAI